jgi:RNA polymerase sigma-70 factor (ECF subfamily)
MTRGGASFSDEFTQFAGRAEPKLRRALVATWGPELGRDATIDALVYGWRHWARVRVMTNPVGYLYVVGRHSVRPERPLRSGPESCPDGEPWVEPGLERALRELTEPQRVAVILHHSFDWTYQEIAEVLGIKVSSVRNHLERGMNKLRVSLGVARDA